MPHPYPGQEWKHGWIPVTPTAAKSKNHGRKPGRNSAISRVAAEAAEVYNRMKAQDAQRDKKPNGSDSKAPPAPKPPAAKPAVAKKPTPAAKPQTKPVPAAKSPPRPAAAKPGKKAGADSNGKALREGDEVRITGGAGQGRNGHVVSKGKAGTVRVRTADGQEVDVHSMNLRNREDLETSRQADAAIRSKAGRTPTSPPPSAPAAGGASIPEIQKDVRDVYNKLARKPGDWIPLTRIRERLAKNLPRQKVDEALHLMNRMRDVNLAPENNTKALTQADHAAAVHFGDQDKHQISIGGRPAKPYKGRRGHGRHQARRRQRREAEEMGHLRGRGSALRMGNGRLLRQMPGLLQGQDARPHDRRLVRQAVPRSHRRLARRAPRRRQELMARRIQANPRDRVESSGQWRSTPRPVDWPARVAAVLKRDISCRWLEAGLPCRSIDHLEVDHIGDPKDHDLANLRALCRTHHRRRTGQQGAAARKAKRIPRARPAEQHPGLL